MTTERAAFVRPDWEVPSVTMRAPSRANFTSRFRGGRVWMAWFVLLGLILPAWEAKIFIAGQKLTLGRVAVILLFVPALIEVCRRGRRIVATDYFMFATASWMLITALYNDGLSSFASVSSVAIELAGGYLAGRAFFKSAEDIDAFIRTLKILTIVAVFVALLDNITGRWVAHDLAAALFKTEALDPVFRGSWVRAASTFDHPILFGTFCGIVSAIFIVQTSNPLNRIFYSALCLVGCILSQSSVSIFCYVIVLAAFSFDAALAPLKKRWTIFWIIAAGSLFVVFQVVHNPVGWIISHLTLDPDTGYFRILIWDSALDQIAASPIFGHSYGPYNEQILDLSVDSVWLVSALRFGLPMIVLLFFSNVTAMTSLRSFSVSHPRDRYLKRARFALTTALFLFMFAGLTVHYWNYMWIFWAICIGVGASLRESSIQKSWSFGGHSMQKMPSHAFVRP